MQDFRRYSRLGYGKEAREVESSGNARISRIAIKAKIQARHLGCLINGTAAKLPRYPLAIFVDTNIPFKCAETVLGRQAGNRISRLMQILLQESKENNGGVDPHSMIVFSNHPHHYAIRVLHTQRQLLSVLAQQPAAHPLALESLHTAAGLISRRRAHDLHLHKRRGFALKQTLWEGIGVRLGPFHGVQNYCIISYITALGMEFAKYLNRSCGKSHFNSTIDCI